MSTYDSSPSLFHAQPVETVYFGGEAMCFTAAEILKNNGVYAYFDEGQDICAAFEAYVNSTKNIPNPPRFHTVIDLFAGAGHASLPIHRKGYVENSILMDVDGKALSFARHNAELNGIANGSVSFKQYNIEMEFPVHKEGAGVLFVANPPFAVNFLDMPMDRVRDGGSDGLKWTRMAVQNFFCEADKNSAFVGVAYALIKIDDEGQIIHNQLADLLNKEEKVIDECRTNMAVKLLKGRTLWRGANGRKEQPNPMPLTHEHLSAKAKTNDENKLYQDVAEAIKGKSNYSAPSEKINFHKLR